jgi:hypothetical protein
MLASNLFSPSFYEGRGVGYTSIFQFRMTEERIVELADIIAQATQCFAWKDHVMKQFRKTRAIPRFFRAFYNLVSPLEDSAMTLENQTWLWNHLDTNIFPIVCEIRKEMRDKKAFFAAKAKDWKKGSDKTYDPVKIEKIVASALRKVTGTRALRNLTTGTKFTPGLVHETADVDSSNPSWSVLSLFFHSAICVVPNIGTDIGSDAAFAFWPAVGPKVNNRHVEINKLTFPETGYIDQLCNAERRTWSGQPVRILPYCITGNKTKQPSVPVEPVIGTSYQGTDSDNNATTASDTFAGKLVAEKLTFEEVNRLYKALTENDLADVCQFPYHKQLADKDKAIMGLGHCMLQLSASGPYRGLATLDDWCKLYVQLWMHSHDGNFQVGAHDQWMHPTTPSDLTHKTMLLFMSFHRVRFCFIEGQKRVTTAKHALMAFQPKDTIVFHGTRDSTDTKVGGDHNFYNQGHDYTVEEKNLENKDRFNCLQTFHAAGKSVSAYIYHFNTNDCGLNASVTTTCQLFSAHLVAEGNAEQVRSWMNIVVMLCADGQIINKLTLHNTRMYADIWYDSKNLKDFIREFRELFMKQVFESDRDARCLEDNCDGFDALIKSLNAEKDDGFVACALFQEPVSKKSKNGTPIKQKAEDPKKYKSHLSDFGFEYKNPVAPKVTHAVSLILLWCGLASKNGLSLVENVAVLQGKRNSAQPFFEGFNFGKYEENYVQKVRFSFEYLITPIADFGNHFPKSAIYVSNLKFGYPFIL